ncbi:hypothetical protein FLL45_20240 [Aliikangiella marina]|uniref:Uncharacterized protein n=1 Tax=Aliikangiella marina TaxID=1712262 RepID=A0A545T2P9_9GAMM|nr:hypothetical protein [Aliikangiella marina]TQV71486.1 hypothetical protein FLL45_20240 [Aliikangiella marina]
MSKSPDQFAKQQQVNTVRLGFWTFAWLISQATAVFGPTFLWQSQLITGIAILINLILGGAMIFANIRHIKGMDELQQKIHMDAMGITLGVGVIGGLAYSTMDTTNFISSDAEISYLVIVMALTYLVSIIVGQARYK